MSESVCFPTKGTPNITFWQNELKRTYRTPTRPNEILATTYPGIRAQASQHKKRAEKALITTCQFS